MKKIFLVLIGAFCLCQKANAQVVISDNENDEFVNLNTDAALKIISEKSGVLLPRLSKIRINEKQENYTGEMFFSREDDCLMINVAPSNSNTPEWKCVANEPEAIPKY